MDHSKTPVGYLFQMTCDTGNGKHLTVSGNFALDADTGTMNAEIDKIGVVFDRLRAKHELPLILERIEGTQGTLQQMQDDLELYEKKHPEGAKHRDEAMINKMRANIAAINVNIAKGQIAYAEAQLKAK
jgi:hypothetical protein